MACLMEKLLILFLVAVVSPVFGTVFRHKRQFEGSDDKQGDMYEWKDPNPSVLGPWQIQNQLFSYDDQYQNGDPWQNEDQNSVWEQDPWQNIDQNGGSGQDPWQNQNQDENRPGGNGSDVQTCIFNCPRTHEYNPVCGTNDVKYENPGHLQCAINCGVDVQFRNYAPCRSH